MYRGDFNDLLKELASDENWRAVYGAGSRRGKDQELILRFFALYHWAGEYSRPMKTFLNKFMEQHRSAKPDTLRNWKNLFLRTADHAHHHLGRDKFRPERNLNAAVLDALFVALAKRLSSGPITGPDRLADASSQVLANETFLKSVSSGTTGVDAIRIRLDVATRELGTVP